MTQMEGLKQMTMKKIFYAFCISWVIFSILFQLTYSPPFRPSTDPNDYELSGWKVHYFSSSVNESLDYNVSDGLMNITVLNLNTSLRYVISEIRIDCTGFHYADKYSGYIPVSNSTSFNYVWEIKWGDVRVHYGIALSEDMPLVMVMPIYMEK